METKNVVLDMTTGTTEVLRDVSQAVVDEVLLKVASGNGLITHVFNDELTVHIPARAVVKVTVRAGGTVPA